MNQNLIIPPEDWAATPVSIQSLIQSLIEHFNATQGVHQLLEQLMVQCRKVAATRPRTEKQAVFVCDLPTPRQAKLAWGLKQNGWDVILLHKDTPWFDPSHYFSETLTYTSAQHATLLASTYSPTVYHCFSSWNFGTSIALIDTRPGKVVFDSYDCMFCLQGPLLQESFYVDAIRHEKFCYENATGTCHRHASGWYAHRKLGYNIASPIFFPEYCWGPDYAGISKPRPKRTDGIHCVYVGNLDPTALHNPAMRNNTEDIEFIRSLTDRGVHYHLYPSWGGDPNDFESYFAPILEESARNQFLHLHRPLKYEQMMEEISEFHFGVMSVSPEVIAEGNQYSSPVTFRLGTANKAFDYLDAGLILISHGFKNVKKILGPACEYVPRSETGAFLSKITPESFQQTYPQRIDQMLDKLSIANQCKRLAAYYESL